MLYVDFDNQPILSFLKKNDLKTTVIFCPINNESLYKSLIKNSLFSAKINDIKPTIVRIFEQNQIIQLLIPSCYTAL